MQAAILRRDEQDLLEAVRDLGQSQQQQGIVDIVKRIFDPIGITGRPIRVWSPLPRGCSTTRRRRVTARTGSGRACSRS